MIKLCLFVDVSVVANNNNVTMRVVNVVIFLLFISRPVTLSVVFCRNICVSQELVKNILLPAMSQMKNIPQDTMQFGKSKVRIPAHPSEKSPSVSPMC